MNNTHEHALDTALTRLLSGEDVAAVAKEFPELESELFSYATTLKGMARLKDLKPHEGGLHAALRTARTTGAASRATPSPFLFADVTRYSFAYRGVFVLPLLLVVLLASGAYFIPRGTPTTNTTYDAADTTMESATLSQSEQGSPDARSMKAMTLAPAMAPEPTALPQDSTLAAIYGPELSHDAAAVEEDSVQAASVSDDTTSTAEYTDAYDEQSF